MSLARRRRLVEVARERELLVLEDNPYGLLRYEGEALPTLYSLDAAAMPARSGASDLVDLPGHVLEDPLAGPAAGLGGGAAAGAREAEPGQAGCGPVLLAGDADVRGDLLRGDGSRIAPAATGVDRLRRAPAGSLQTQARRDARGAARSTSADAPAGRAPRAVCSSGRRSTAASTRPTCSRAREGVAFVPGRAAYVDGRRGSSSMRLNFAGRTRRGDPRGHPPHRPGRWAATRACWGRSPDPAHRARGARTPRRARTSDTAPRTTSLAWPTSWRCRGASERSAARRAGDGIDERRAEGRGAQGRGLAGAHRVAALGRARAGGAGRGSATRWSRSTRGRSSVGSCTSARRTRRSWRCTGATARTGPSRACLEAIGVPYTGSGPAACMRCTDKALAKFLMREAGIPTPDFTACQGELDQGARRGGGAGGHRARARVPAGGQARQPGARRWASSSRARSDELPGAIVGALSYDRKVVIERYVQGRDLAVSVLGARARSRERRRRRRCRWSRRSRARRTSTTTSRATRSA